MILQWQQRRDGFWNADCPCGCGLCGLDADGREAFEAMHLDATDRRHEHAAMLQPSRVRLLAAWFALSAAYWEMQREGDTNGVTDEEMSVLDAMKILGKALLERYP